jgi:hypothetical protein
MNTKTAIRLAPQGRYFLGWHKFFHRQGDRAVFHISDMQVFLVGDEFERDMIVHKLRERGHNVRIVGVVWDEGKKNFTESNAENIEDADNEARVDAMRL